MKVAEILDRRRGDWEELDRWIGRVQNARLRSLTPNEIQRFGSLYRSTCADLALAEAYKLPEATVQYLHHLVARGHNVLYRSDRFRLRSWGRILYVDLPRRILRDPCVWIATALFWSLFLGSMAAAVVRTDFARNLVGEDFLAQMEEMYAKPLHESSTTGGRTAMAGFYVLNNAGIGLRCFATGVFLGVGSLFETAFESIFLGAIFGAMAVSVHSDNFFAFVTAHGPFELTAICFSAAAGLRLGWSVVGTGGYSRAESLRRQAPKALELAMLAALLFGFAAFIEAYVSPSTLPYGAKASVALLSAALLILYVFGLGWPKPREADGAT
jgi:uncharacterized membrane protein SpoIIM required for sporulation